MILVGDVRDKLRELPDGSVHCVVTSPPYWGLRDYGVDGQIGLEKTPDEYVANMVAVFREVWRVLRDDGTLWLNLGDSYAGSNGNGWKQTIASTNASNAGGANEDFRAKTGRDDGDLKPKDLVGIPWRVAFALQADGWYLRQDIIWAKPNPMPESVTDRCTKSHEYLFLLSKSPRYYFDNEAIKEPAAYSTDRRAGKGRLTYDGKRQGHKGDGQEAFVAIVDKRNKRDVWTVPTKPYKGAHFATFPPDLILPCVLAGTSEQGCCSQCGSPIVRQVHRTRLKRNELPVTDPRYRPNSYNGAYESINGKGDAGYTRTSTIGWGKSCGCATTDVVPCTVLDPFFGAGTTGVVAKTHGRDWIGIELNPEYAELAGKRVAETDTPLAFDQPSAVLSVAPTDQDPLFSR